jgi:hypothetical protein
MTNNNTGQALTKDQVKFLNKRLESVVFRYIGEHATLEAQDSASKALLTIPCKFDFHVYGDAPLHGGRKPSKCFAMIHTPDFTEEWRTVAKLLRAGDVLELEFLADAWSNQYLKVATGQTEDSHRYEALHVDNMRLRVYRHDKRALTFQLAESICPDNSARMIQF